MERREYGLYNTKTFLDIAFNIVCMEKEKAKSSFSGLITEQLNIDKSSQ